MKTLKINYLGKKYLEQCPKITIKQVYRNIEESLKQELLNIELEGIEIVQTKANYGGYRKWFACPECGQKSFTLYSVNNRFVCRKCSGLKYKKQAYKGMLEEKVFKNQ
jgi:ribosomal protein S27AE